MTDKQITLDDFTHRVPVGATIPKGTVYGVGWQAAEKPHATSLARDDLYIDDDLTGTYWTAAPIPAPTTRRERLAEVMVDAQRLYYGEQSMPLADLPPTAREAWLRCAAAALAFLGAEGDNQ